MMGTGEAEGQDRSRVAAESAISNPLLEDHSMKGARGVLINITGGLDMTLHEVDEAANRIREEVDPDANIIFGSTFDATMQGRMRVSVVATGIAALAAQQPTPNYLSLDMNRPAQTGQPALSRPPAPPVGRVAMPAAAAAPAPVAPVAPPAPVVAPAAPPIAAAVSAPSITPVAVPPPPAPVVAPLAPVAEAPPVQVTPAVPETPAAPPAPVAVQPAPAPVAPPAAPAPAPAPAAAAPAPTPTPAPQHKPMVGEDDWRVTRPSPPLRPAVRSTEHGQRAAGPRAVASENRVPNLFQRITGAFATAKPAAPAAPAHVEPTTSRPASENVVAAPKPVIRPAPVQTSIDVTERAKPARDDDDLQIPAFLRRQAN
jgi:cell division protein FtsZ